MYQSQKLPKFSFFAFKYPKWLQFSGKTKILSMTRNYLYPTVCVTYRLCPVRKTYTGYTTYICSFRKLLFREPFNAPLKRKSIIFFLLCIAVEGCIMSIKYTILKTSNFKATLKKTEYIFQVSQNILDFLFFWNPKGKQYLLASL